MTLWQELNVKAETDVEAADIVHRVRSTRLMDRHQTYLYDAAKILLDTGKGRWKDLGYGRFACTSCGAQKSVDYDHDHKHEVTEPCSRSCPWRRLEEAVEAAKKVIG